MRVPLNEASKRNDLEMKREMHLRLNEPRACTRAYGFVPSAIEQVGDRFASGRTMA